MKQVLVFISFVFLISCGQGNDKVSGLMDQYSKTLNEYSQAANNKNNELQDTLKNKLKDLEQQISNVKGNFNPEQSIKWIQLQADTALKGIQNMVKDVQSSAK